MKKFVWFLALFVVFAGSLPMAVEPGRAADCEAILAQVKGERRLLKRRKILREAITSCPKHAEINFQYGYILERLREYDDALQYYQNAVRLNTRAAKYYFGLGDVYKVLGNKAAAIDVYEKGLRFEPENERAQNTLASLRGVPRQKSDIQAAVTPPKVEQKPPVKPVKPEPVKVAKVEEKQKAAASVPKSKPDPAEKGKKAVKPDTASKVQKEQKPAAPQFVAKVAQKPTTAEPAKTVQKPKSSDKVKIPVKKVAAEPKPPVKVAKKKVKKPPVTPIKPTQVKQAKASPVQTTTKPEKAAAAERKPTLAKAVQSKPQPKPVMVASVKRLAPLQLQRPLANGADLFSQQQDEGLYKFTQFFRGESQRKAGFRKLEVPKKTSDMEDQKRVASRRAENKRNEAIDELKIDPSRPIIVYYGPDRKVTSRK